MDKGPGLDDPLEPGLDIIILAIDRSGSSISEAFEV
jgi:hypothetical protein